MRDGLGMTRREYMRTSCAAATALLALNKLGCNSDDVFLREVFPDMR